MSKYDDWAVIYVDTNIIIRTFKNRAEAEYYVTDCFGPERNIVQIIEIGESHEFISRND